MLAPRVRRFGAVNWRGFRTLYVREVRRFLKVAMQTVAALLSGTFYSTDRLPPPWHAAALVNPFFYMIDGFRYAFIGHADGSIPVGIAVMVGLNAVLLLGCHALFARGYKLKA